MEPSCVRRKKAIIFLLGLFYSSTFLFSQEGNYQIQWLNSQMIVKQAGDKSDTTYRLNFEGAIYDIQNIPYYAKSFPVKALEKNYSFVNPVFEVVPDSILNRLDLPGNLPEFNPKLKRYSARGAKDYLDLYISTIRMNPETKQIERLRGFSVTSYHAPKSKILKTNSTSYAANNSLLSSGFWYKFRVKQTGVYQLSYSDLKGMGFANPANVRLFGNGGEQLSYWNADPRPVDLTEIAFYMDKGADGVFNEGDRIILYLEGPVTWHYDNSTKIFKQKLHGYSKYIYYFLTDSQGTSEGVQQVDNTSLQATVAVNQYDAYQHYEKEQINVRGTGRVWFSKAIDGTDFDTTFNFANLAAGNKVKVLANLLGRSEGIRFGYLKVNNEKVVEDSFSSVDMSRDYYNFGHQKEFFYQLNASSSSIDVGAGYEKYSLSDEAYLDYITINARSNLKFQANSLAFRDINSIDSAAVAEFNITNMPANYLVWDVTNINNIHAPKGNQVGSTFSFKAPASELREYLAIDLDAIFPLPEIDEKLGERIGSVENQNLRALSAQNYLILSPNEFNAEAERLANYHREKNGLTVAVIDPEQIYNEFSSGTPDLSALRDFIKHQYEKEKSENGLKYVLLFGDGSYINHIYSESNSNHILTYESLESVDPQDSYTSDDFFALLDTNEGDRTGDLEGKMDIGVGRLPVRVVNGQITQATNAVDKILSYDASEYSDWRRRLVFVADDQKDPGGNDEELSHMQYSDQLAEYVNNTYSGFEVRKLYLDAYPQVSSASGESYPDANQELANLFERGMMMFCYTGHGSENQLTGEQLLIKSDVETMKNGKVLPLFITATCQFSRFDHVETSSENIYDVTVHTSAGEEAFLNPDGGAIALLTTSRLVYGIYNQSLVLSVLSRLFQKTEKGDYYTLGDVLMMAKNEQSDNNKLNFVLLGDPAMKLVVPQYQVFTDSVNGMPVDQVTDTLMAYSKVTVSGHVADDDSVLMADFNGLVYPSVYDKVVEVTTFGNDNQTPFQYEDQKNLLYRGKATVKNGRFKFSFIVPKDIAYNFDKGKISYYADNGEIDAKGEFKGVYIGGTSNDVITDNLGPDIALYINNTEFVDGGMTDPNPFIYAEVSDENGINTTGVGVGHDIVAVLNNADDKPYVLNDYYEGVADDYTSGIVRYQLNELEEGFHTLKFKVWDIFNNSSTEEIGFQVINGSNLVLEKVYNYPNPATDYTYFQYTHNIPFEDHKVEFRVYDLSGRVITIINQTNYEDGYVSQPLYWDMRNSAGRTLSPGVYPYQLTVTTSQGISSVQQRLIILK